MSHVKMGKHSIISQYRERLDRTLASRDLVDDETLTALVKDQVLYSQKEENRGFTEPTVLSERVAELSNLLDLLRSASDDYVALPNKTAHPSWKVKSDNEDLRVMYREGPLGSPFHTLLAEGYIDGPMDACLSVAWETSIYQTWFPEIKVPTFKIIMAKRLEEVRIGEQISIVRVKLPWPLTDREVILRFSEYEYFEDDLIIVVLNSVPDAESLISQTLGFTDEETVGAEQIVRLGLVGGFAFQKVTADRSYFRTIINLDMKLDFVPPSFINFISRQLIGSAFRLYQKSVASIPAGNVHFGKVLNDPMYRRIREGICLRTQADSNQEHVIVHDDASADPKEHYENAEDEFPDEVSPECLNKDIQESS